MAVSPLAGPLAHAIRHQLASVPTQKRRLDYRINSPPALAALPWPSYETKLSSTVRHSKVQVKALSAYSRSMASVLSSRHSSCTQSSAAGRGKCCQVTPCRVSSASGTKAGTVSKNTLKGCGRIVGPFGPVRSSRVQSIRKKKGPRDAGAHR